MLTDTPTMERERGRERKKERGCCQCIYNGEREAAAASISPFY